MLQSDFGHLSALQIIACNDCDGYRLVGAGQQVRGDGSTSINYLELMGLDSHIPMVVLMMVVRQEWKRLSLSLCTLESTITASCNSWTTCAILIFRRMRRCLFVAFAVVHASAQLPPLLQPTGRPPPPPSFLPPLAGSAPPPPLLATPPLPAGVDPVISLPSATVPDNSSHQPGSNPGLGLPTSSGSVPSSSLPPSARPDLHAEVHPGGSAGSPLDPLNMSMSTGTGTGTTSTSALPPSAISSLPPSAVGPSNVEHLRIETIDVSMDPRTGVITRGMTPRLEAAIAALTARADNLSAVEALELDRLTRLVRVARSVDTVSDTVALGVGTSVSATVATSLAAAVSTSSAVATSAAASGAAAASAAGAGSAASGVPSSTVASSAASVSGIVPLLLGAQRFVAYGGLAVDMSHTQAGVAASLPWINLEVPLYSRWLSGSAASRRLSEATAPPPPPLSPSVDPLYDQLSVVGLLILITCAVQALGLLAWRCCVNRRAMNTERQRLATANEPHFVPLPSALLFPNLLTLALGLGLTGLVKVAAAVLVGAYYLVEVGGAANATLAANLTQLEAGSGWPSSPPNTTSVQSLPEAACGLACAMPALVVLALVVAYMLAVLVMIIHVYCFHRARISMWVDAEPLLSAKAVDDPLLRAVQQCFSCCRGGGAAIDRARGTFEMPAEMIAEPQRTQRLLARPVRLCRSTPADAHAALSIFFLARARGSSFVGMIYDWVMLTAQLSLALLLGAGPHLPHGSTPALLQVVGVLAIQLALATWIGVFGPGADRVGCWSAVLQLLLEATLTALLLLTSVGGGGTVAKEIAFVASLMALFVPGLMQMYDGIFVPLVHRVRAGEKQGCLAWALALLDVLLFVPKVLTRVCGTTLTGGSGAVAGVSAARAGLGAFQASFDEVEVVATASVKSPPSAPPNRTNPVRNVHGDADGKGGKSLYTTQI